MDSVKWCTIESDPGVFTELIKQVGIKGIQVEELVTLEKTDIENLGQVFGLVFLFKWNKKVQHRQVTIDQNEGELFFAQQVIQDACASQAILSILLNIEGITLPDELKQYKEFCKDLPYDMRGESINNLESLRAAHNSFHAQEPYITDNDKNTEGKKKDVFHFISYVPFKGKVYELDGLQKGPVLLGKIENDWIDSAKSQITKVIQEYSQTEIHFNLLAFIKDRKEQSESNLLKYKAQLIEISRRLGLTTEIVPQQLEALIKEIKDIPETKEQLESRMKDIQAEILKNEMILSMEDDKRKKWQNENIRRKHNYIPFIFELLKTLSKQGKLAPAVEKAKTKMAAKKKEEASKKIANPKAQ